MFAGKLVEMFNSLSPLRSFTMSRGPASAAFLKSSATDTVTVPLYYIPNFEFPFDSNFHEIYCKRKFNIALTFCHDRNFVHYLFAIFVAR